MERPIDFVSASNYSAILRGMLNGVKHTADSFAQMHDLNAAELEAVMQNQRPLNRAIVEAIENHPPLNVRDLVEPGQRDCFPIKDDTTDGAIIFTARQQRGTVRTFVRGPQLVPYYDYADTAMSRTSLFRPEWIKELYVHDGQSPNLPDWSFNQGHFECQVTYFIGCVNFHWIDKGGTKYARRMNTGDMNYNTPFLPHTFTTREAGKGLILAVTYGGSLATEQFRAEISSMPLDAFCREMARQLPAIEPGLPTDALHGVMITRYKEALHANSNAYSVRTLLSGVPFQPFTRAYEYYPCADDQTLDLAVDSDRWGYNVGDSPVAFRWGKHESVLQPGDSFFIQPGIPHAFRKAGPEGKVVVIEIRPEAGDPLQNLALIYKYAGPEGLSRVHSETKQWF